MVGLKNLQHPSSVFICPRRKYETNFFRQIFRKATHKQCLGHIAISKSGSAPDVLRILPTHFTLNLRDNKLTTLPECVDLEVIDLGHNNFSTLPECAGQLVNLKMLYLTNNKLTTLPNASVNLSIWKRST